MSKNETAAARKPQPNETRIIRNASPCCKDTKNPLLNQQVPDFFIFSTFLFLYAFDCHSQAHVFVFLSFCIRFVLKKDTLRFENPEHFVLRIIHNGQTHCTDKARLPVRYTPHRPCCLPMTKFPHRYHCESAEVTLLPLHVAIVRMFHGFSPRWLL